jgi:hypothetical protein
LKDSPPGKSLPPTPAKSVARMSEATSGEGGLIGKEIPACRLRSCGLRLLQHIGKTGNINLTASLRDLAPIAPAIDQEHQRREVAQQSMRGNAHRLRQRQREFAFA